MTGGEGPDGGEDGSPLSPIPPPGADPAPADAWSWRQPWARVRRIAVEIGAETLVTLMMIGLLWFVEKALDITQMRSRVLFEDAIYGANLHYGLRLGSLFDLLDVGVLLNFIYRSIKHASRIFGEDER
jgi:hypothetical protein